VLSFKIVSKEDLLGKLFDREVTLRARFEQIRAEVADLRSSFDQTRQQVRAIEDKSAGNAPAPAVVQAYVDRALHQIRKNHTESRSIEVSFRDLREEMVNNRVDTGELLERIERRVIEPMSLLNSADFLDADRRLGTFRLAMERQTGLSAAAEETVPALDHLIAQMDAILAEMRDRGTFNELIQSLQDIIQREKQLLEQTEDKRIEGDFFTPQK
jgi:septation ring formation regulator EzrA